MDRDITLRIVLETPPPGVDFGIQRGRGSLYETVQSAAINRTRSGVRVHDLGEGGKCCGFR